jgi:plasmid stabilization system protein ParE
LAKVDWSIAARDDLRSIALYIAADSPVAARRFVARLRRAAQSLSRFPERGRPLPEAHDPELREIFVGSYRIMYRVRGGAVGIVGVAHGARDVSRLLDRE